MNRVLGLDPTLAMIMGTVLFIVIVIGIVAMSHRGGSDRDSQPGDDC